MHRRNVDPNQERDATVRTSLPRIGEQVRDQRIEQVVPLLPPDLILDHLPLGPEQAEVVLRGREEIAAILNREDDRLLAVVGPCSVHDRDAALDYGRRLAAKAGELEDYL